ncbi:MAG: plasmid mobilization relaxosome protein MobC [Nitrospira sp.]|nr:plasmid mobilization relaxosome protein MobC [Nitrospira sp.]
MPTSRPTQLTVDLGDLKAPWVEWCAQQQLTPSEALRQLLRQTLQRVPRPRSTPHRVMSRHGERPTRQVSFRLTPSEYAALATRAKTDGYRPTHWLIALIRTQLTRQPSLSEPERQAVAHSTKQLLALGRNLNQIARALNKAPAQQAAVRLELLTDLSTRIRTHVDQITALTRASLERWELRP